ncbi:INO80 complex subunit B [Entomophthora muscae]|uniref:INO80 complex subunit B n=1 Tax=Entomophthora muscae TaxID=34485 RepID=A0ACC2TJL4_9FUNG|nr:INO80 complex subunit B [Entomophthora muscae]
MASSLSPSDSPEIGHSASYIGDDYVSSPLLEAEEDYEEREAIKPRTKPSKNKAKGKSSKESASKKRRSQSNSVSDSDIDIETTKPKSTTRSTPRDDSLSGSDQELQSISKPLTKRQKAKYLDEYTEELQELKEESRKKHFTAEELALRRSETARRRKHQSQQKAEKDKLETINRLLKKQANKKSRADQQRENLHDPEMPTSPPKYIRYIASSNGESTLSFPEEYTYLVDEFKKEAVVPIPRPVCMAENCNLPKKYCHPKTLKVSCSLDHYRLLEAQGNPEQS